MQISSAKDIALTGLQYLAGNPEELGKFLAITGYSPQDLRKQAATQGFSIAILEFFVNHEPDLLAFAASCSIKPQDVVKAYQVLGGSNDHLVSGGY